MALLENTLLTATIIRARAALNRYIWASPSRRTLCEAEVALGVALAGAHDLDQGKAGRALLTAMNAACRVLPPCHHALDLIREAYALIDDDEWVRGGDDIISVESWAVA